MALKFVACVVVVFAALVSSPLAANQRPSDNVSSLGATIGQEEAARDLAEKYAPIVYIRNQREPCDTRGSPYLPAPVEFLFAQQDIVLRQHDNGRTTDVGTAIDGADLYGLDDTYFLDFPGNPRRPGCVYEQDYLSRSDAYTPTAYAHIAYEEGRNGFALQYWLFYYFNHWNNTHEGDWEMIQLTFDEPTPADALSHEPSAVGYSQHAGGERSQWDDEKLSKEGDKPVAFVAAGANANQFEPNVILGRGDNGTGFGCDDARRPSRRVELRVILMEEPTGADSEFAWLAFEGRWGERAPWEFNGPTGPNDKLAWTQPFTWQERLRPSSVIVPAGDTLGFNSVNLFCDVVWYLSTPFAWLVRLPPWVFVLGIVGIAGGFAFTATRTSYRPVIAEPLRRRRHFGQVLTAAGRIYRRHLVRFLGIGALFVPLGMIEAAVQWQLFQLPFEDTIAGFFPDGVFIEALIALAIGNFASGIFSWLVQAASLVALSRTERQEKRSAWEDYRDILPQLPGLLIARLRAVAIVTILAVSVVGIPWAFRQNVRWAFIEQAMLLDRVPRSDAADTSAGAVDGRWWHTFACLFVLGLVAYFTGPLIAFVLLFWSSLGVSAINLASSIIFAAVTPFVAIAETLLYFDRRTAATRAREDE